MICGRFMLLVILTSGVGGIYYPVREYAGSTFFDKWEYYGAYDNTTLGNVVYQDKARAISEGLTFVNSANHAIIKVDNTTRINLGPTPLDQVRRNSVRIQSQDTYGEGNLVIIDVVHMPYGCSVWPAFWTVGTGVEWPNGGEIDIIEGVNQITHNEYSLHSASSACQLANPSNQTGSTQNTNCASNSEDNTGCVVFETKPNSYGAGFADAGGGVWAIQLDYTGVYIWFWSRPNVPQSLASAASNSSIDLAGWGTPSAAYPSTACPYTEFFTPQQLVLQIDLCGGWAGSNQTYQATCQTPTGSCIVDNVMGSGGAYDTAYWEISYIRTYVVPGSQPAGTLASGVPGVRVGYRLYMFFMWFTAIAIVC